MTSTSDHNGDQEPSELDQADAVQDASHGPEPTADDVYRQAVAAAQKDTIATLTAAARLRHPQYGELDFADFLAGALSSVAANLGSTDKLLAGRSGSWEADLVGQLVRGTVGSEDEYLIGYRTEPITLPLNVNRLITHHAWDHGQDSSPYETEIQAYVESTWDAPTDEHPDPDDAAALAAALAAEDAHIDAIRSRWATRYSAYAEQFTAAVAAEAARIEGLTVPVTVEAVTDPDADYDQGGVHPDDLDIDDLDPITWRLWDHARQHVALPGTERTDTAATRPTGDSSADDINTHNQDTDHTDHTEQADEADEADEADQAGHQDTDDDGVSL